MNVGYNSHIEYGGVWFLAFYLAFWLTFDLLVDQTIKKILGK